MNKTMRNMLAVALLPIALLTLSSCKSDSPPPPDETTKVAAVEKGVPGGVVVETHKMTANVTAIDTASRTVTLLTPDGKKTAVKCGREVVNFDQIRVGDQLKVTVTEELVAYMSTSSAPPSAGAGVGIALYPKGAKPGGIIASTVQVTAIVTEIDLKKHKATLQFPDGSSRTVAVREDVDLKQRRVGEQVVIRTTETIAISVEKP